LKIYCDALKEKIWKGPRTPSILRTDDVRSSRDLGRTLLSWERS
jgi:hypothetical protein